MSSPLALAAVTATLCDLLNNGLVDNDLAPIGSFSVTAVPPDRIETGDNEANRLNLFLYQVTPNLGWRNFGLPSFDGRDPKAQLTNPPLALDLHYMLTAYGAADWAAEILLGYGMELLHDARILSRTDVRKALSPKNPISVSLIPPDPQGRLAIDLADQIEQVKITPQYLTADELSRLWTAMQARYRPTMVYQACTVLIQGVRPVRSALPVLRRGDKDQGVDSRPNVRRPDYKSPTLTSLSIVPRKPGEVRFAAELGDGIELGGALLTGSTVTAEFYHPLLTKPNELPVSLGSTAALVKLDLPQSDDTLAPTFDPAAVDDWPAGTYSVGLRIERAGKPRQYTNVIPFNLAPRLTKAPQLKGKLPDPRLDLNCAPKIWPGQRVQVFVGAEAFALDSAPAKTDAVSVVLKNVTTAERPTPVRLRVDGVDSQFVRDRKAELLAWSRRECCLPAGSTRATLLDETPLLSRGRASNPFANHKTSPKSEKNSDPDNRSPRLLRLKVDDVLMFEETRGCATGSPADADPARRHAVRLTRVHPTEDPLTGPKSSKSSGGTTTHCRST